MNRTLFQSKHTLLAILLVLAFVGLYASMGASLGRGPGSARILLLATGWTSLLLMLVVMGYVLRKYAHRGRYSPEFRRKVDYANLERADNRIRRLRQQINAGTLPTAKAIGAEAARILKEEGVHRVNRALVEAGPPGGDPWTIRIVPTEPLGRVARWMHVHAAYGAAFGCFLVMHSGGTPGSTFGWVLAGLGYLVTFTGLIGIVLWAMGPSWLTAREKDLSIEEATAFQASLKRKRDRALEELEPNERNSFRKLIRGGAPKPDKARKTLDKLVSSAPDRTAELQDIAALIAQERTVAGELRALRRVRASFMAWKLVHIPAAILLTGLVAVHVLSIWKY
ncbi:MAG: hypothetical protein ACJAQ3_001358 [Planctomycetota bacterium]